MPMKGVLRAAIHSLRATGHREIGLRLQFTFIDCPFEIGMEFHLKKKKIPLIFKSFPCHEINISHLLLRFQH